MSNITRNEKSDKEDRFSSKNINDERDEGVGRDFNQADKDEAEVNIIGHVYLVSRKRETIVEKRGNRPTHKQCQCGGELRPDDSIKCSGY